MTALLIHQQEKRLYELICTDEQKSDLSHSGVRQKMTSSLHKKKEKKTSESNYPIYKISKVKLKPQATG